MGNPATAAHTIAANRMSRLLFKVPPKRTEFSGSSMRRSEARSEESQHHDRLTHGQ
jgi:hypothetical protein